MTRRPKTQSAERKKQKGEEEELGRRIRSGDHAAIPELTSRHSTAVIELADLFGVGTADPALLAAANAALNDAAADWNPDWGTGFSVYMKYRVRVAIIKHLKAKQSGAEREACETLLSEFTATVLPALMRRHGVPDQTKADVAGEIYEEILRWALINGTAHAAVQLKTNQRYLVPNALQKTRRATEEGRTGWENRRKLENLRENAAADGDFKKVKELDASIAKYCIKRDDDHTPDRDRDASDSPTWDLVSAKELADIARSCAGGTTTIIMRHDAEDASDGEIAAEFTRQGKTGVTYSERNIRNLRKRRLPALRDRINATLGVVKIK